MSKPVYAGGGQKAKVIAIHTRASNKDGKLAYMVYPEFKLEPKKDA